MNSHFLHPPRRAAELFSVLSHIVTLKTKSEKLTMAPPTNLDVECQTYVESVLSNLENVSGAISVPMMERLRCTPQDTHWCVRVQIV